MQSRMDTGALMKHVTTVTKKKLDKASLEPYLKESLPEKIYGLRQNFGTLFTEESMYYQL